MLARLTRAVRIVQARNIAQLKQKHVYNECVGFNNCSVQIRRHKRDQIRHYSSPVTMHRVERWNKESELQKQNQSNNAQTVTKDITLILNDETTTPLSVTFNLPTTIRQLLILLKKQIPINIDEILVCRIAKDSPLIDLNTTITNPNDIQSLSVYDFSSPEGKDTFWHSTSHILGEAIEHVFGDVRLCDGPALSTGSDLTGGFFYEAHLPQGVTFSEKDYSRVEKRMKETVNAALPYERMRVSKQVAKELFHYNPFKLQILESITDEEVTLYRTGDLIDLCRGPHVPNTKILKAFKLYKHSGTNWNKDTSILLQRLYGISFPRKEQLTSWEERLEQASKRDHRIIGRQQDLFMFHELSPGTPFFLPHGTRVFDRLTQFIREQYRIRGYQEVISPQVFDKKLWETSGHWQNYKDDMFVVSGDAEHDCVQALKPMNCPGHCLMFASKSWSYRDLPVRWADFSPLHRNELRGALSGLTRVRRFHQDDSHIFCTPSQVKEEIKACIDFVNFVYTRVFDFQVSFTLSTRPDKYVGQIELWDKAEDALKQVLTEACGSYKLNEGDGAFYGPKIDVLVRDCIDRNHQLATIQLDFQLPQRFELSYQTSDASDTPVMIHRAILGSMERFIAILIEHCGGRWPLWLSPRQVAICSVSEKHVEYAHHVKKELGLNYHIDVDDSDNKLGKKIRNAQVAQFNYVVVVGQEEMDNQTVNVRKREGELIGTMSIQDFGNLLNKQCQDWR